MKKKQPNPMPSPMSISSKLGIIAGSGDLPKQIIESCAQIGRELFVVAFEGETEQRYLEGIPHIWVHVGEVGKAVKALKKEKIVDIILVGRVQRPAFSAMKLDFGGAKLLTKIVRKRSQGDNVIFTTVITHLEDNGFNVRGIDEIFQEMLAPMGVLGKVKPDNVALNDIEVGRNVACAIGRADVGQAVIVQRGVVLGVEAIEGTDGLIKRCADYRQDGDGGVLIKMKKPGQDTRIDLPAIGIKTVENAHATGLRGIAVEAGGALVIDREAVVKLADKLGVFVVGI